jgi:hypothetical protein
MQPCVTNHTTHAPHPKTKHPRYAEPAHGVVLFRRHDPLAFDGDQLGDLLDAGWLWFDRSRAETGRRGQESAGEEQRQTAGDDKEEESGEEAAQGAAGQQPLTPFLLWNCLPRAGASQFHGHAQVGWAGGVVGALCFGAYIANHHLSRTPQTDNSDAQQHSGFIRCR